MTIPRNVLVNEILWVMRHYGSDAGDRAVPGSKLEVQAKRIADFVEQWEEAERRLEGLDLIAPASLTETL